MAERMSSALFAEAKRYIAGGVNSPVRAFGAVGGSPLYFKKGKGCRVTTADGRTFIDYCGSWGPLILGHAHPAVLRAVRKALDDGTSFGAPTERETVLAKMIVGAVPSIERIRFVSSGTEAVMSAVRLARGYTGCDYIIKFKGCYHGHSDFLLAGAGSGALTFGIPDSLGVPKDFVKFTIVLPYNDSNAVKKTVRKLKGRIAAVILEPVGGNMGVVPAREEFLKGLRDVATKEKIVLIFDEVITGFRLCYGGAQNICGIVPDMTCLGKIIGGGFPVGAFGGRKEIMDCLAPVGGVYQAGTLSGNPVAMATGIATLRILSTADYEGLGRKCEDLCESIARAACSRGKGIIINRVGSMFTVFFTDDHPYDYDSAKKTDTKKYARFFKALLGEGIYFPPSNFETCFLSFAHRKTDIEKTKQACRKALGGL